MSSAYFPQMELLRTLFFELNRASIRYAVLRNYETLPQSLNGSDLDILVAGSDALAARDTIDTFARGHGGKLVVGYSVKNHVLRFCGKKDATWWGLPVDIWISLNYRGIEYASSDAVLLKAEDWNGIRVVSKSDAGITALLKDCLANGCSRKNYQEEATAAYTKNPKRYEPMLSHYFGAQATNEFTDYLKSNRDTKTLRRLSAKLRWAVLLTSLHRSPFGTFKAILLLNLKRCQRLLMPPGYSVAVLGADGSGKSTVISMIDTVLSQALHNRVRYEHLRPNLLPSIAGLFGRPGVTGPVTAPHASKPSGFMGSLARLLYYSLDYLLGYWFKIYPALVKRPTLYVFDRYYYDYLVDPRRSRICLPRWIIKTIGFFIPQPDLILCLGTDPRVIHARKPELPIEEVERQVFELRRFCEKNKRAVWIDTGKSIKESVDDALTAITTAMAARYTR